MGPEAQFRHEISSNLHRIKIQVELARSFDDSTDTFYKINCAAPSL
jgi:hypothetical protein